ncbi:hypothetical protein KSF_102030 [Reticulibacter mediterranei]|uniref:Uncharacterized protein n=1 Tax=Reticulibacter mediterranei TaxID=2778369 RepID=A0A8J3J0M5_9CHLR|nr:hypothetical protein [Reticulibacter mediterranei]GHP00156.1 hypothetical protein KSF_102030 [Reticulibacter mediterranei]
MGADEEGFDSLSPIFQQVPPVTHLSRERSALGRSVHVGTVPIPANDLYFWMHFEPGYH